MMEAQKKEEEDLINEFENQDQNEEKMKETTGKALVPSFPGFTQGIKKQHQQRFGAQPTNPVFAKSMQNALERHEQALMEKAMGLEKERQNFMDSQAYEQIYESREKERKKKENERLRAYLDEQKAFAAEQKAKLLEEKKELLVTNLGPPDHKELTDFNAERERLKQLKNKQDLMDQHLQAKKMEYEMSLIEREQDRKTIEKDIRAKEEEDARRKAI